MKYLISLLILAIAFTLASLAIYFIDFSVLSPEFKAWNAIAAICALAASAALLAIKGTFEAARDNNVGNNYGQGGD